MKGLKEKNIFKDLFVGIMIAAISIPISMGYAQISGLPAVYGLYGSVFPILVFVIISSSPQFIFGVDAAPAALMGGVLLSLQVKPESNNAISLIPVLTIYVAMWLLIFYIFKAGRLVNYISTPVMGGFITGIATTIILMQIPKLMGYSSGKGELYELLKHLFEAGKNINWLSLFMGVGSLAIILIFKKISPKFPMSLFVMILGALTTVFFNIEQYGVILLSKVEAGLPRLIVPDFSVIDFKSGLMLSLPIATVILAESLLSEASFAIRNNYKINENREILAFSLSNLSAALTGCCPVNGSASRTVMSDQYGGKTKVVSFTAAIVMVLVLLFGTGFIEYLPVPVLTAIVIAALVGVLEIDVAKRLYRVNKTEFFIFMGAFVAVLLLGTIYGVLIGLILSFTAMVLKSAIPPRSFLGIIPGKEGFYDLDRNRDARAISNTVIYRFSGSLFFANINAFQKEIEDEIDETTKVVILDAGGIGSIDFTAADRLEIMHKNFKDKGIEFYITEHIGELNDEIRELGLTHLIEEGVIRRTISAALKEEGIVPPYPIGEKSQSSIGRAAKIKENILEEFEWAFGEDAEEQMEKYAKDIIANITSITRNLTPETDINTSTRVWKHLEAYDQDMLLEHLERHLNEIAVALNEPVEVVEENILEQRVKLAEKMKKQNKAFYHRYVEKRERYEKFLKRDNPKLYYYIMEHRKNQYNRLKDTRPELAEHIKKWIHQ